MLFQKALASFRRKIGKQCVALRQFPPVSACSQTARTNFHWFQRIPNLREQISASSSMPPNCGNKFPTVPVCSQTARTNFRSFQCIPKPREEISASSGAFPNCVKRFPAVPEYFQTARRDFRSVLESYWVLKGNLVRQICAFYMLNVLSPRTIYICAMGGGNRCRFFTFCQSRHGKSTGQVALAPRFGRSLS